MEPLERLLQKIKNSLNKDTQIKEVVATSVKEMLGFELSLKDISIKSDTLFIKTGPSKRNEIKLNESKLLTLIQTKSDLKLKRILY